MSHAKCVAAPSKRAHGDYEICERVDGDAIARLDHRGRVELLDDRGAGEFGATRQLLSPVDGRRVPFVEPDLSDAYLRVGEGAAVGRTGEALEGHLSPASDDGGPEVHEETAHPLERDLEALPV